MTSFQAFTRIASAIVRTGSVSSVLSISLKVRLFHSVSRLAQNEAEGQKEQELDGLASVAISTGVEEEACSLTLLLQCFVPGLTRKL